MHHADLCRFVNHFSSSELNQANIEPGRKNRLTRLGFHFLFVGAFAMLGGSLRGFNLLLVLAGVLVGTLVMQWRWSRRSVDAISVRRRSPNQAFASSSFRVRYRLSNHSRFMPVWMIRVEDQIERIGHADKSTAVCGVGVISARQTVMPHYDCVVTRRGRYRIGPVTLMTTFPFALFSSRQTADDSQEFCIYPRVLDLRTGWEKSLISRANGVATNANRSGHNDGEFFGLREYQQGDNPNWIHWRTSARLDKLAVRQFEQQRRYDLCVLLDAWQPEDEPNEEAVEFAVSLVATFLVHLVSSPANQIVLAVAGEKSDAAQVGASEVGKRKALERLADVLPCAEARVADAATAALNSVSAIQDLVVISTRPMADAIDEENDLKQAIQPWMRRSSFRWIDVHDPQIDRWIAGDTISRANRDNKPEDSGSDLEPAMAATLEEVE